jgi:hypothetical protein
MEGIVAIAFFACGSGSIVGNTALCQHFELQPRVAIRTADGGLLRPGIRPRDAQPQNDNL